MGNGSGPRRGRRHQSRDAGNRRNKRTLKQSGHRRGAKVAGTFECFHHQALRPEGFQARGFSDFPGELLIPRTSKNGRHSQGVETAFIGFPAKF